MSEALYLGHPPSNNCVLILLVLLALYLYSRLREQPQCRQRGRVVKTAVIVIASVQNLLVPFFCVLGKNTLRHFSLLDSLGKQFQITVIFL